MRTWVLLFGVVSIAGLADAGIWAFGELTAPGHAASLASAEADARGIDWPLADSSKSGVHDIWHFTYCNPEEKSDNVQISIIRDRSGKWIAKLSEKDQRKWPRRDAVSR